MKPLDPSQLRERVTIQRTAMRDITDGAGEREEKPVVLATVWAAVFTRQNREQFDADSQLQSPTMYDVKMRYRDDVDSSCQLVWRNVTLDIIGVVDTGAAKVELVITCRSNPSR